MCYKWFVAFACLAATLSLAPSANAVPSGLLSDIFDKTICKSEVIYNENENRIPRLIKEVKCAANPDAMCVVNDEETSCCARNSYRNRAFSCKEVRDTVLVSYGDSEPTREPVSIGCSCIMHQVITAEEV